MSTPLEQPQSTAGGRSAVIALRLAHTLRDLEIALDLGDIDMARAHFATLNIRVGDAIGALT